MTATNVDALEPGDADDDGDQPAPGRGRANRRLAAGLAVALIVGAGLGGYGMDRRTAAAEARERASTIRLYATIAEAAQRAEPARPPGIVVELRNAGPATLRVIRLEAALAGFDRVPIDVHIGLDPGGVQRRTVPLGDATCERDADGPPALTVVATTADGEQRTTTITLDGDSNRVADAMLNLSCQPVPPENTYYAYLMGSSFVDDERGRGVQLGINVTAVAADIELAGVSGNSWLDAILTSDRRTIRPHESMAASALVTLRRCPAVGQQWTSVVEQAALQLGVVADGVESTSDLRPEDAATAAAILQLIYEECST